MAAYQPVQVIIDGDVKPAPAGLALHGLVGMTPVQAFDNDEPNARCRDLDPMPPLEREVWQGLHNTLAGQIRRAWSCGPAHCYLH